MSAKDGMRAAELDNLERPVLVCFPMKEEAGPFRKTATEGKVEILVTGIGRSNSERALRERLSVLKPAAVLTCGFAGGLDPRWKVGQVLFETQQAVWRNRLLEAGAYPARFHCAGRIATTVGEKRALREGTGADAVEMESEFVHVLCRERNIACATVRVISDSASTDLPLDFNRLAKPDLSISYGKLALAILKSPGRIPALMELQRNCRQAAGALSEVLQKVLR